MEHDAIHWLVFGGDFEREYVSRETVELERVDAAAAPRDTTVEKFWIGIRDAAFRHDVRRERGVLLCRRRQTTRARV